MNDDHQGSIGEFATLGCVSVFIVCPFTTFLASLFAHAGAPPGAVVEPGGEGLLFFATLCPVAAVVAFIAAIIAWLVRR